MGIRVTLVRESAVLAATQASRVVVYQVIRATLVRVSLGIQASQVQEYQDFLGIVVALSLANLGSLEVELVVTQDTLVVGCQVFQASLVIVALRLALQVK